MELPLGGGMRVVGVEQLAAAKAAGSYQVQWDARNQQGSSLSSGVYITRLSYPGGVQTQRLLYLK